MILKEEKFNIVSETERLVMRPLREEDYKQWLEGFHNKLPSQNKYDDDKTDMSECTQEAFNDVVQKHQELAIKDEVYVFSLFRKKDNKNIGYVDFSTIMRDEFQWGAIGYRLHNQFWRQGYGKEAVKEALHIAFKSLHFHRIEAHINLDNTASIHLAESVGMKFECIREKFIYEFGGWTDNLIYYMNAK